MSDIFILLIHPIKPSDVHILVISKGGMKAFKKVAQGRQVWFPSEKNVQVKKWHLLQMMLNVGVGYMLSAWITKEQVTWSEGVEMSQWNRSDHLHAGHKTLFPSDKIWKLLQKINRLLLYFWPWEITEVRVKICNYLFQPAKWLWCIQILFKQNSLISDWTYLPCKKLLLEFDSGNCSGFPTKIYPLLDYLTSSFHWK